jgi:hypothetical protein
MVVMVVIGGDGRDGGVADKMDYYLQSNKHHLAGNSPISPGM